MNAVVNYISLLPVLAVLTLYWIDWSPDIQNYTFKITPSMCLQEAGSNPLCRRLQLKDLIPTGMQRLTKYPLLLDNIAKYTSTRM